LSAVDVVGVAVGSLAEVAESVEVVGVVDPVVEVGVVEVGVVDPVVEVGVVEVGVVDPSSK
jgi:hypothetical protein